MSRIEVAALTVHLGGQGIVSDVDLMVPPGTFTAVVGPNGSGKTTLLRAVYRAVPVTAGVVLVDGEDVLRMPMARAARLRAVVPQFQDAEVALTAADVVATGRHAHAPWWAARRTDDRAVVLDAMRRTGSEEMAGRMFGTLSGGERQRVLLARALVQEAATLLLDEPTNHLDARAQLELMELLADLPQTRVAVLHDLDHALAYADRIAVLDGGRLVATGTPAAVLTDDLTRTVFGVRSAVMEHPLTGRPHLLTAPLVT